MTESKSLELIRNYSGKFVKLAAVVGAVALLLQECESDKFPYQAGCMPGIGTACANERSTVSSYPVQ